MERSSTSNSPATGEPCERVALLLIDDDADFRDGLAENLRDDGHPVREYQRTGEVPAEVLDEVALAIVDYQLADADGLGFADHIHTRNPPLPIVLITSYWSEFLRARTRSRNYLRLLRKPLDYERLHKLVHELTARQR